MFTSKAQAVIDRGKGQAFSAGAEVIGLDHFIAALLFEAETKIRLLRCLTDEEREKLSHNPPRLDPAQPCPHSLPPDPDLAALVEKALFLASAKGVPDRRRPGLINPSHLVLATAMNAPACALLQIDRPLEQDQALVLLDEWRKEEQAGTDLPGLFSGLRAMRAALRGRIFGQDHAIHTFVEGLYNSQVTAGADLERKRPGAVFVFAGPPGVGKTYLAEEGSAFMGRPFKRFDMTGFSDHHAQNELVGFGPSYKGAHEGALTGFVKKHPNAVLLFDEIEKAHLTTVQLFYQILDAGRLEDKFTEEDVSFKDTVIIFTTNAGRSLYDNPNRAGIAAANSSYHKRTILSALENEKNPADGRPAFPRAICSRLAQGYPVMFNHLGPNELVLICRAELEHTGRLFERQHFKSLTYDERLPMSLVLRSGGLLDARELRSEAEAFIKNEMFKLMSLFNSNSLSEVLSGFNGLRFTLDQDSLQGDSEAEGLFKPPEKPRVLLAADPALAEQYSIMIPEVRWQSAVSADEALDRLSDEEIDLVLVDLWVRPPGAQISGQEDLGRTIDQGLDNIPLSAKALAHGREILRKLHERSPHTPVYLLSLNETTGRNTPLPEGSTTLCIDQAYGSQTLRRPVDEELFMACVRAGGARGMLATGFTGKADSGWRGERDDFRKSLLSVLDRLHLEKTAARLSAERKALGFETVADLSGEEKTAVIRLRNFSLTRTMDAADAGEMLEEVQRPDTRFEDVFGASAAKESLTFVLDWLKDPRRYQAMGIRAPKGILLAGAPGTGKTMLARALAGEASCAFLEKSASSFITIWQGSGPQNVRDLFARARRYAPAIVFIDEIDSIGIKRGGGAGGGARAQEETLNAVLTKMDGFSQADVRPVIVLAATNLADHLDPALRRRFDRVIEVDRPDTQARLGYLEKSLSGRRGVDVAAEVLKRVAAQTAGMTIADLERVLHQAAILAAGKQRALTGPDLEEALERLRMGEARKQPSPDVLKRVARHEAGHALMAMLGGNIPLQVTIVGRASAGGFMEREVDEDRMLFTKAEIMQFIAEAMAGRASEMLFYGDENGLSTGVSGDLDNASRWAMRMVTEFGMDDGFGQIALPAGPGGGAGQGAFGLELNRAARKIVEKGLKHARQNLEDNRALLELISSELLKKNRLTRQELIRLQESV